MTLPLWAGIGIFLAFGIAVFAVVALLTFVVTPWWHRRELRKRFPQRVEGFKARMRASKFSAGAIGDVLLDVKTEAVTRLNLDPRAVQAKLDGLMIDWIRIREGHARMFVDSYGRKVAGDHDGNTIRVAVKPTDKPGDTALVHECLHELAEAVLGHGDEGHVLDATWGAEGIEGHVSAAHR